MKTYEDISAGSKLMCRTLDQKDISCFGIVVSKNNNGIEIDWENEIKTHYFDKYIMKDFIRRKIYSVI